MSGKTWFEEQIDELKDDFDFRLEGYILNFTRQLCDLMASKKITQSELAKRLGVSKAYISEVLSGTPNLTIESIVKLSDAVGGNLTIGISDLAQTASTWKTTYPLSTTLSSQASCSQLSAATATFTQGAGGRETTAWVNSFKHLAPSTRFAATKQIHPQGDYFEVNSIENSPIAA